MRHLSPEQYRPDESIAMPYLNMNSLEHEAEALRLIMVLQELGWEFV